MTSKNYFVENIRMTGVMISKTCGLSGITGKYIDFSKIKLFRPRANIAMSKNKLVQKKFE